MKNLSDIPVFPLKSPGWKDLGDLLFLLLLGSFMVVLAGRSLCLSNDPLAEAGVARHIIHGHGFVSDVTAPSLLREGEKVPFRWWGGHNLWILALSLTFSIMGPSDLALIVPSAIWYLAGLLCFYIFLRGCVSRFLALIMSSIFAINSSIVGFVAQGLTEPCTIFVFLLSLLLFLRKQSLGTMIGLGVILALGVETSPAILGVVPVYVLLTVLSGKKQRIVLGAAILSSFVVVLGMVALVTAGWGISQPGHGIHSMSIMDGIGDMPPSYSVRVADAPTNPVSFVLGHPMSLIKKYAKVAVGFLASFLEITDPLMAGLFLCGFLSGSMNTLKVFVGLTVLFSFPVYAIPASSDLVIIQTFLKRMFSWLIPVYIFYSINYLWNRWGKGLASFPLVGKAIVPVVLFLMISISITDLSAMISGNVPVECREDERRELGKFIRDNVGEENVIVTDIPWLVGWYGHRHAIWLPYVSSDSHVDIEMKKIRSKVRVDFLYLSTYYDVPPLEKEWKTMREGKTQNPHLSLVSEYSFKGEERGFLYRYVP